LINLTRLNHSQLVVNADLIEFIEATPDTVVTLTTGRKIVVREPVEDVIERVVRYRRMAGPCLPGNSVSAAVSEVEDEAERKQEIGRK
jgi:flagellar protein FlbD